MTFWEPGYHDSTPSPRIEAPHDLFQALQREYVWKAYRVRNRAAYEAGLRGRGSLTICLGLTEGVLANWNAPRAKLRKPGRQREYSNRAIETTVALGMVFGLAPRQAEGLLRSLLAFLALDNEVRDHTTISRRQTKLGKVSFNENRTTAPVHLLIDSSGLAVPVGQLRKPPRSRDCRKLHLAVAEQTADVVACELTSQTARNASRVPSPVSQGARPIASAKADAACDVGEVCETPESHHAQRLPGVLITPGKDQALRVGGLSPILSAPLTRLA